MSKKAKKAKKTVRELFEEIVNLQLLEDRREYSKEQLQEQNALTTEEAEDLFFLIQREFDPTIAQYSLDEIPALTIKEYLQESIHGGWDGFPERDQIGFVRLIDDIMLYYHNI